MKLMSTTQQAAGNAERENAFLIGQFVFCETGPIFSFQVQNTVDKSTCEEHDTFI